MSQTRSRVFDRKPRSRNTYDFIIIGSSPSGCVIANRLTEDPSQNVLLLEAGAPDNFVTDVPAINPFMVFTDYNWDFKTEPNSEACWGKTTYSITVMGLGEIHLYCIGTIVK